MRNLKYAFEALCWLLIYSPVYPLFCWLDYLSKNSWGVRDSERRAQLIFIVPIILISCTLILFLANWVLYKRIVLNRDSDKAETLVRGRGILDVLFNRRYKLYVIGGHYWIDNATMWYDVKGNLVGRINWIDEARTKKNREARVETVLKENNINKY